MSSSPRTEHPARWRSPRGWPLRTRIVAIIITLLTILGLAVGTTAYVFLHDQLYSQVDTKLEGTNSQFRAKPNNGNFDPDRFNDRSTPYPGQESGSITVYYEDGEFTYGGKVLAGRDSNGIPSISWDPLSDAAIKELKSVAVGDKVNIDVDGQGSFRATASVEPDGAVRVTALSLKTVNDTLLRIALVTAGAILIAIGVAGWAGAFIVRRTLAPLDRVAATATKVSELKLDRGQVELAQRVPEQDTDPRTEVGQVGAALNQMLDHVGNALEARHASEMQVRQFVADASHELRTPLAAIRGYAELSRRSRAPISEEISHVLNRVESEAKRMTLLVEDLLLLARLDAGRPLAHDPVDLTMLVVDTVSDAHAAGPGHYWQLDLPEEPVIVYGDGARLHQVLANLLANARTHTPEGTAVTVAVTTMPNAAVIHVIDSGPGIPAELQPHIFERFARGDSSRSRAAGSTGLGLSIVHAVVTAHRGKVAVQSEPGRTVFSVMLPYDAPQPAVPPAEQQFAQLPS
ncbi:sensor histidine kinase [Paractinoplanes atraurantiacus]|uniref:histidine kinase n=1 Tax=Paractinoplanes atraurantiacus TaxID=1036182 RepID=A0A285JTR8_9ACTN|nr:HAMP domain-containing sensor histidine kinase [Actinoplanes atraurantiacus]SNY62481.1 two-component system, OmpR family, sensor kinase [Actinoplanes atraurantiacus]